MKKIFYLSLFLLTILSCSKEYRSILLSPISSKTKTSNDSYVFNSSVKAWMINQDDPYELSNVQRMVDCLKLDFIAPATHYAIKIFPRDENELNTIIQMPDIIVSYIPFGYSYASKHIADSLDSSSIAIQNCYREQERYFISSQTDKTPLPVLYAAWPVKKNLPHEYDFAIQYSACIPDCLENECSENEINLLNSILGNRYLVLSGYAYDYDDLLQCYVPVKNLRLRLSYGLSSVDTYTNNNGYFVFSGNINTNALLKCVYENSQFRITDNSLISMVEPVETVASIWVAGNPTGINLESKALIIHRAANHFYNGGHAINTPASSYSLRLNFESMNSQFYGSFNPSPVFSPSISLRQDPDYDDPKYLSNVLHELGHFNHYQRNGGFGGYYYVHSLIKESYADYISWYVGRDYYTITNGGSYNPNWDNSLSLKSAHQYWRKTDSSDVGYYSPFFIDLYDDLNQMTLNPLNNDDPISGIPHSVIPLFMEGCQTWQDIHNVMFSYVGAYYSYDDYVVFISPYDYFLSVNSL